MQEVRRCRAHALALDFIEELNVKPNWKFLHLAPEIGIYDRLTSLVKPENYVGADLEPKRIRFANCRKIDLTQLEGWASNEFLKERDVSGSMTMCADLAVTASR